jgi:hypothetical protein
MRFNMHRGICGRKNLEVRVSECKVTLFSSGGIILLQQSCFILDFVFTSTSVKFTFYRCGMLLLRDYTVTNSMYGACSRRIHTCCNLVNITNIYHLAKDANPFIFIERKAPFTITSAERTERKSSA